MTVLAKSEKALVLALDGRKPAGGRLSADLSGGIDSTSLAFLASRTTPHLLTHRWAEAEAGNDDNKYAALAMRELPAAEHLVIPQADIPPVFTDPHLNGDPEQPYLFARTSARAVHTARTLAAHGSTCDPLTPRPATTLSNHPYRTVALRFGFRTALLGATGNAAISYFPIATDRPCDGLQNGPESPAAAAPPRYGATSKPRTGGHRERAARRPAWTPYPHA